MKMRYISPSKISLPETPEKVQRFLTFTDRSVQYQIKKMKENYRWQKSDPQGFLESLEQLKEKSKKCLMFDSFDSDEKWTYSGLWKDLQNQFGWDIEPYSCDPSPKSIPWAQVPPEMRYYQEQSVVKLLEARHGAIQIPTGGGKSLVILNLCKRMAVQTCVITPAKSITNQIYKDMVKYFGKKFVGKYGDGKKELGKLFTVCTAQSLTRIAKDSDAWEFFRNTKQLIWDESHTTPSETFEKVCLGILEDVPYRFFVSATQLRADGSEMVLKGIIGPIVYSKEFKELVDEGFLAKPSFKVLKVPAVGFSASRDINVETRNQLYLNPNVNKLAAEFAYKAVTLANRQTVILIDEFRQFMALKDHITIPFEFVHGGASDREDANGTKLRDYLPEEYWDCDIEAAVDRFNKGETKLLIGTSAISTGVDLKPVGCLIYLQGGISEVKVRQAIGRGTRITENKKDVIVVDFKVMGSPSMERHANERIGIYQTMGEVAEIDV